MNKPVLFKRGTQERYDLLKSNNLLSNDTWYYCVDTHSLYIGLVNVNWPGHSTSDGEMLYSDAGVLSWVKAYTKAELDTKFEDIDDEITIINSEIDIIQDDIEYLEENKADKATTLSGYGITNAYTKTEIDNKISAVFKYKGSVPTYADLIALTGMVVGDVYNITETGDNYAWTDTELDKLAGEIDLTAYLTKGEALITYETIANVQTLNDTVSEHTGYISDLEENKADKDITLSGYGITDAYTKTEVD